MAYFDELLEFVKNNKAAAFKEGAVNPIYVILSKYYLEGHTFNTANNTNKDQQDKSFLVEPLAIIHPQHSERIRAQQGVFTIFPFPGDKNIDDFKMEYAEKTRGILHKIIISNPYKMANELKNIGVSDSWLYPEAPIINSEIEAW